MYLYGASGHAKVIIDILIASGQIIDGLIDDNESIEELLGYPVFHDNLNCSPMIVSIGNNTIRKKVVEKVGARFCTAIHPSVILSNKVSVGDGTVIMQGAIVQSCVTIGKHCIINTGASVDHDCLINDYVHVSPRSTLCGNVTVGEGAWVGAGSVVIPGVKIGKWSVVGAGTVILQDVPEGTLVVGNRTQTIKNLDVLNR